LTKFYAWKKGPLDRPAPGTSLRTWTPGQRVIPTCCGPWHNKEGHFVTFYMCEDYRSILYLLSDGMPPPPCVQYKLHRAIRESFNSRSIPIPAIPPYRYLPRISIKRGAPLASWSCGAFTMSTKLHLFLEGRYIYSLPALYITREHIFALPRALLEWLILGTPTPPSGPLVVFTRTSNPQEWHTQDHTCVPTSKRQTSSQEVNRGSMLAYPSATRLACRAHTRRS